MQAWAEKLIQAAAVECVAGSLLDLERRLPASAMRIQAFDFWHGWRQSVRHAATPSELFAQARLCTWLFVTGHAQATMHLIIQ